MLSRERRLQPSEYSLRLNCSIESSTLIDAKPDEESHSKKEAKEGNLVEKRSRKLKIYGLS